MKMSGSMIAIKPNTRLKISFQTEDGKWVDFLDVAKSLYDLVEGEDGELVNSSEPSTEMHILTFQLEMFVPMGGGEAKK